MQERRKAENAKRRQGGSSHKPLSPQARERKIKKQFNKRHRENPEMRTNKPRRKFQNRNPECLSRTNVTEVHALRYDALLRGPALDAATRRAEEAEAKVAALEKRAADAEARDQSSRKYISDAKDRASIRRKKRAGVEPSMFERHRLKARKTKIARTAEALGRESKARAAAEAKLAESQGRLAEAEGKLAEHADTTAKLAEMKDWFSQTGLSVLVNHYGRLPTWAELESYFAEVSD